MKINFLVVLYDCDFDKSKTLQSLAKKKCNEHRQVAYRLCIWNNGPKSLNNNCSAVLDSLIQNGWIIDNKEDIKNRPLSKIYNDFINNTDSDRYIILDHDSLVSKSFFDVIQEIGEHDLILPRIIVKNKVYYPTMNGRIIDDNELIENNSVLSIGSGICIGKCLARCMVEDMGSVFDERFALYGVDTTFFLRLKNISRKIKILCKGEIFHSLSRLEIEDDKIIKMRSLERAYDLALTLRHYPSLTIYKFFIKMVIGRFINKNKFPILPMLICYLRGRHHRC